MIMASEIDRVMDLLSEVRKENAHEHELIHNKLNAMAVDGTAVSRQNHEIISMQGDAIGRHEKYINRQAGQVAGIALVTTILVWVGKFFLTKVI